MDLIAEVSTIEIGPGLAAVLAAIISLIPTILSHFANKRNAENAAKKVADQAQESAKAVAAVAVETARNVAAETVSAAEKVAAKVEADTKEVVGRVMLNDEKTEQLTAVVGEMKTVVNGERDKMLAKLRAAEEELAAMKAKHGGS